MNTKLFLLMVVILMIMSFAACDSVKKNEECPVSSITKMIDLHLHLDGAISLSSARQLAKMQSIALPENDDSLLALMRVSENCHGLNEFLQKFTFTCSLIQTPKGLETCVHTLCEELHEQGIIYAEIRFAPQRSCDKGMTQEEAVQAAITGLKNSTLGARQRAQLILCCMRGDTTAENVAMNMETIRLTKKYLGKGVCAADLAGAESLFPTENFSSVFAYARSLGVPFEIHAGEADGPKSIYAAMDLGASRIGHGTRCMEDANLVALLSGKKMPLLLCPTSNVQTCVVDEISKLPVRTYLNSGIMFCINTDDPSIEGTDLKTEWRKVIRAFHLTTSEVRQLMLNAVTMSFAPEPVRAALRSEMLECYGKE